MRDQNLKLDEYKNEILKVEKEFENMVRESSMADTFLKFASEAAVLFRNNELIRGKEEIKVCFSNQNLRNIKLEFFYLRQGLFKFSK